LKAAVCRECQISKQDIMVRRERGTTSRDFLIQLSGTAKAKAQQVYDYLRANKDGFGLTEYVNDYDGPGGRTLWLSVWIQGRDGPTPLIERPVLPPEHPSFVSRLPLRSQLMWEDLFGPNGIIRLREAKLVEEIDKLPWQEVGF
jgi:hypothetical protein